MSILQFSEHFQLIFVNSNVNNDKQIKQKNYELFFCNLFRIIKFFFLILLKEATLESKVASTIRNSSALLLHTSETCSNVELSSIFSQTFLELLFVTKIKTMLLKQSAVNKILRILCVWTLKILFTYWLNKNSCLNIVLWVSRFKFESCGYFESGNTYGIPLCHRIQYNIFNIS